MIAENWLCGRKRHLWVSVSADLMEDAKRDLKDIGFSHIKVPLLLSRCARTNGHVHDASTPRPAGLQHHKAAAGQDGRDAAGRDRRAARLVRRLRRLLHLQRADRKGPLQADVRSPVGWAGRAAGPLPRPTVRPRRAEQLVAWLGSAQAEGCILFDESHKAKNLAPEKGKKCSQTAVACEKMQASIATS